MDKFNPSEYRVLVVEDSDTIRYTLEKAVKNIGYSTELAKNGNEALTRILNNMNGKIDAVLLDVIMPGINGFEVCRKLKEIDEIKDIPVIFLTALDDIESIEEAKNSGGFDFILKPFKAAEISMRIKNAIISSEQESRHSDIMENSQDIIYITSFIRGEILEISNAVEQILGYKSEELIGELSKLTYFDEEEREAFLKQLVLKGSVSGYRVYLKDKEGQPVNVSIKAKLIRDKDGKPEKIIGTMHEVVEIIMPFCCYCRKQVRKSHNSTKWISLEEYLKEERATNCSHSICPDCVEKMEKDYLDEE